MKVNRYFLMLFLCGTFLLPSLGFTPVNGKEQRRESPKPTGIQNILFYIQRSINISTLNYTLNVDEKGELNITDPIKIYWKNYASDGSEQPLNYIQRKYAYGLEVKMIDKDKKSFCFNFVSYKKKKIYLIKSPVDNKYYSYCEINNKMSILEKIFIQIEGGTFWFPKIKYIEISGKDFSMKEDVLEKIIP